MRLYAQVGSWLWVGSLRGFESQLVLHALQPAISKRWRCPGCEMSILATYSEIQQHLAVCSKAQGLPSERLESEGYEEQSLRSASAAEGARAAPPPGAPAGAGAEASPSGVVLSTLGIPGLTEHEEDLQWGRRRPLQGTAFRPEGGDGRTSSRHDQQPADNRRLQAAGAQAPPDSMTSFQPSGGFPADATPAVLALGDQGPPSGVAAALRDFKCPICGLEARLTAVQVLQHRSSHQQ